MGGCKITKFVKAFSLESFPLYGMLCVGEANVTVQYTRRKYGFHAYRKCVG